MMRAGFTQSPVSNGKSASTGTVKGAIGLIDRRSLDLADADPPGTWRPQYAKHPPNTKWIAEADAHLARGYREHGEQRIGTDAHATQDSREIPRVSREHVRRHREHKWQPVRLSLDG
jgi:hypothetical protein